MESFLRVFLNSQGSVSDLFANSLGIVVLLPHIQLYATFTFDTFRLIIGRDVDYDGLSEL